MWLCFVCGESCEGIQAVTITYSQNKQDVVIVRHTSCLNPNQLEIYDDDII